MSTVRRDSSCTLPSGQTTSGQSSARRLVAGAPARRPARRAPGPAPCADGRCSIRKLCRWNMRPWPGGPTSTGPPALLSMRPTRRRISARTMRSPSSASATSSARSDGGRDHQHLDVADGVAVDQRGAAGHLAHLAGELAGAHARRSGAELPRPSLRLICILPASTMHAEGAAAGLEHLLAVLEVAHRAEAQHALDLGRRQGGECLVAACGEDVIGCHDDSVARAGRKRPYSKVGVGSEIGGGAA